MARRKRGPKRPPGDYEVGYGKPPKETRWQNGQSGNLKGRPPKEEKKERTVVEILDRLLEAKVTVRDGAGTRKVSRLEVLLIRAIEKAGNGDLRALKVLIAMRERYPTLPRERAEATAIDADDLKIIEDYLERLKDEGEDET
jgi:hypothetical protein